MTSERIHQAAGRSGLSGVALVVTVGSLIGLSIMGDSLMYSVLPLAAPGLGIPLPFVGVLLSINRLIRLISNGWASRAYERWGAHWPFLGSLGLGALATLSYGFAANLPVLVGGRGLWGIAWSGLRQGGYQAVWTGAPHQKGRLTGLLWGLVRMGSAIGVLAGGVLYDRYGFQTAMLFVIATATLAVPAGLLLRWAEGHAPVIKPASTPLQDAPLKAGWRSMIQTPAQRWLVVAAFVDYLASGVIVSTTAVFVSGVSTREDGIMWLGIGVATLTGLLHGVRWITDLAFGPLVGALSDRIGQAATAALVAVCYAASLALALTLPPVGAVLALFAVLLCDGAMHIVMSAAATGVALTTSHPHTFVSIYATTTDAGSALGPLVAYSLVEFVGLPLVYGVLGTLLLLAVGQFWRVARTTT
jgi:MFS family permease